MATVRRTPGYSTWQVRYRDPDGRQRKKHFRKKVDAENWLHHMEVSKLTGTFADPALGRTTFSEWANGWLYSKVNLKPKTHAGYESLLRVHLLPAFGSTALNSVSPIEVRDFVSGLHNSGMSSSRVRQAYGLLSAIFKGAVVSGYLGRTPCVGVALPRVQPREALYLDAREVATLADTIARPYGPLVYVLAYTGVRWAEAVGLRRRRCLLLKSRLEIAESLSEVGNSFHTVSPKSGKRREVVLPPFVRDLLAAHIAEFVHTPDGLVFTTRGRAYVTSVRGAGTALRNSNFRQRVWLPALKEASLEGLRIHDLRHTCASLMISAGAHPKAVQAQLGHSSIAVTMDRYGHLFPSDQEDLAVRLDSRHRAARNALVPSLRPVEELGAQRTN